MEDFPITLILVLGVVALVMGLLGINYYTSRKRREALQQFAQEHGFNFAAEDPTVGNSLTTSSPFELFKRGHGRRANNVLSGRRSGVDFSIFDYRFTTGSGKNSHTYNQTVILLTLQNASLVPFFIRPEGFFDKVAVKFGGSDINFPDRPEFSGKYRLTGPEESAIRGAFNDSVLSYFESQEKLWVEASGSQLLYYTQSHSIKPEDLLVRLENATQLSTLLHRTGPSFY